MAPSPHSSRQQPVITSGRRHQPILNASVTEILRVISKLSGNPTVVTNVGGQAPLNIRLDVNGIDVELSRWILTVAVILVDKQRDGQCAVLNTAKLQSARVFDIQLRTGHPVSVNAQIQ